MSLILSHYSIFALKKKFKLYSLFILNNKSDVNCLLQLLNLNVTDDRTIESYSGGNKRKLSIAVALLRLPNVLLLDEPSASVDICTKYQMWLLLCIFIMQSYSNLACDNNL
ncbi:ATP-binding cassette sub-family A member 13-like protein [Dinothrombium tinctorium]|uniref:ATP-binding cassette sub-family A member 13-like protein n=1 Tax=Dinothrombium tinctorium TaxID=1965070 RepID=A0A443QL36_9ACAR|nr:ATP-binding cassette sub-family A member 13-like protein [Dinothrombium tinctorium]